MNVRGRSELLFCNFNQDQTCLIVGTTKGFSVYRTNPFTLCYQQSTGGVRLAEMLFSSSMIALVGSGDEPLFSPRKLRLCNTRNNTLICELNFITAIQAVKLNKKRMIVVMETKIHIYDITNVRIMHTIDTITNSLGLVAFSPSDNCNLVYPANRKTGDVCLFDALSLHSIKVLCLRYGLRVSVYAWNSSFKPIKCL